MKTKMETVKRLDYVFKIKSGGVSLLNHYYERYVLTYKMNQVSTKFSMFSVVLIFVKNQTEGT